MDHLETLEAIARKQVGQLCKADGVLRWNTPEWVDRRVHHLFGIIDGGLYEQNVASISTRFRDLIGRLQNAYYRQIALYCLNLTGDPNVEKLKLGKRQEMLRAAGGPARSKCNQLMRDVIIPELVQMMLTESSESQLID